MARAGESAMMVIESWRAKGIDNGNRIEDRTGRESGRPPSMAMATVVRRDCRRRRGRRNGDQSAARLRRLSAGH